MALTDAGIKALKPKPTRYLKTDRSGLCLEVLPSGKKSWLFRYRIYQKAEKVVLGRYPDLTLAQARAVRDEKAAQVRNGLSPAREKQQAKKASASQSTLREFGDRYFAEMVTRNVKDPSNLRRYLDREIYPSLGQKPVKDVTSEDIRTVVLRKRDNGQESAAAALRGLLKRLFDYAVGCGVVQINPVSALPARFVTIARSRTRSLSQEEIRILLQTLYKSNVRRQFKLAIHLILLTLARKSELIQAEWKDIDFDLGEWQIPAENSKTGKPHIVYLSVQALALLNELRDLAGESLLVLPSRSSLTRPFSKAALNKALEGVNFAMKPFTIHDLRRTASTLLHEKGFPSDVVEKSLNHTIGGVRGVYNRAEYAEQRRKMLQFWGDFVEGLASEKKILVGHFGSQIA